MATKMILLNGKPLTKQAAAPETAAKYAVEQARTDNAEYTFADDFFAQQASMMVRNLIWTFNYYLRDFEGEKTAIAPQL